MPYEICTLQYTIVTVTTLVFENDNDVILYSLEKIIAYARNNQYNFLAQSIWWISSIIGLQWGLISYIDTRQSLEAMISARPNTPVLESVIWSDSKPKRQHKILKECEEFPWDWRQLRDITKLKRTGKTRMDCINSLVSTKKILKGKNREKTYTKTEGIESSEIERMKSTGECLRCAWPPERNGSHRVRDFIMPIKLDQRTLCYPKGKLFQQKLPLLHSSE